MKIIIKATNMELTPAIHDYVEKKIGRLERFLTEGEGEARVYVEVGKTSRHHHSGDVFRAEVQLSHGPLSARIEKFDADLYAAIDMASDELIQEATKKKDKRETIVRRGHRRLKNLLRRFGR